jgi:hypothetical protein
MGLVGLDGQVSLIQEIGGRISSDVGEIRMAVCKILLELGKPWLTEAVDNVILHCTVMPVGSRLVDA